MALWLLGQARSRGLAVTIDPGSAAFLARMEPGAFLRWTDGAAVCFPNRDEAAVLVGEADPATMATRLTRHYGVVALKLGGAGCVLAMPGQAPVRVAAHPARARDTTGAGDAFCGAFVSRWLASHAGPADRGPDQRGGVRRTRRRLGRHAFRRPAHGAPLAPRPQRPGGGDEDGGDEGGCRVIVGEGEADGDGDGDGLGDGDGDGGLDFFGFGFGEAEAEVGGDTGSGVVDAADGPGEASSPS